MLVTQVKLDMGAPGFIFAALVGWSCKYGGNQRVLECISVMAPWEILIKVG